MQTDTLFPLEIGKKNTKDTLGNKNKSQFRSKIDLDKFQLKVAQWNKKNFGNSDRNEYKFLLGIMEELGELVRSHVKKEDGIRINEDHDQQKQDAIGDIMIFLLNYCESQNYILSEILERTWNEVKKRNWIINKVDGKV